VLGDAKVMAFVATKDPARAEAFYGGVLGLRLVGDERYALVFDAGGGRQSSPAAPRRFGSRAVPYAAFRTPALSDRR
jgi:catechol 2,3-dioxygenase-like lactoylglutathione lyase family enzyme